MIIRKQESKWNKSGLHLQFILEKKEAGPYWKRLTKEEKKFQNITFDWDKYVDEDEEEEEGRKGLDGFDPSQMRGIAANYLAKSFKFFQVLVEAKEVTRMTKTMKKKEVLEVATNPKVLCF